VKRDGARFELLQISYRFVSPRSSCRFSTIFTDIHLHGGPALVRRYLPEMNGTINLGDVFGGGVGRATALAFAREGASVVVADISEQANQQTARMIEELVGRALDRLELKTNH
jgi:hypothetical protein